MYFSAIYRGRMSPHWPNDRLNGVSRRVDQLPLLSKGMVINPIERVDRLLILDLFFLRWFFTDSFYHGFVSSPYAPNVWNMFTYIWLKCRSGFHTFGASGITMKHTTICIESMQIQVIRVKPYGFQVVRNEKLGPLVGIGIYKGWHPTQLYGDFDKSL